MACNPAPGLVIEAAEGKKRGWLSSGIVADDKHLYGFHVCSPAPQDYSLQGLLNRPACYCACAHDMQTRNAGSRNYVASVFERIRAGVIEPTRAEFIGSSNGRDVWYWNWKQGRTIERYRGEGHDLWCHQACFRSAATKQLGWLSKYDSNGRLTQEDTMTARDLLSAPFLGVKGYEWMNLEGVIAELYLRSPNRGVGNATLASVHALAEAMTRLEATIAGNNAAEISRDAATQAFLERIVAAGGGSGGTVDTATLVQAIREEGEKTREVAVAAALEASSQDLRKLAAALEAATVEPDPVDSLAHTAGANPPQT